MKYYKQEKDFQILIEVDGRKVRRLKAKPEEITLLKQGVISISQIFKKRKT